ncbi:MAG: hypothetical protein KDM91_03425 [Verrucomicrobiae bacterium]|nr:hypothetical protein [Verrucomicrobiae bacterium]MCP5540152.1 hypothetical protein [Akkermansiaceae bacterium]
MKTPAKADTRGTMKVIRLKTSSTDYLTYVRATTKVLGTTGPAASKTKPNKRLLSLANLES